MPSVVYPASPVLEPAARLTRLEPSYKFRAFLAILSILLFFLLYAALVVGLGFLVYGAITYDMGSINKITILMKVGAIAGSVMLLAFTLKFLLKLKNHQPPNRILLKRKEYPELYHFIDQVCAETGAPKPKNIYADPDVNAYVSYSNMWLSLFLPVRKNLTIGLGLVDCLDMSEFKAVISHEFGHFAQSSMKIGSYIHSANTIIHDMIFSRDKWDNLLDQWRGSDIRLSAAAWIITPIIWLLRQVLALFYQFLNLMHSSLSREMEFNADKVAVSTSGSDAIVSALWKLEDGMDSWNATLNYAYSAGNNDLFSNNLYHHNALARKRGAKGLRKVWDSLPEDPRGGKQYFTKSEVSSASMYASHPPNDKREANAKTPYIPCERDERSPWVLFEGSDALQQSMTQLIYRQYFQKAPTHIQGTSEFEAFIQAETEGKEALEAYGNSFEIRFFQIPDLEQLNRAAATEDIRPERLEALKESLGHLMQPIKEFEETITRASRMADGSSKEKSFTAHGRSFTKKNIQEGLEFLFGERQEYLDSNFGEWDRSFCAYHLALAQKTGHADLLLDRYRQHQLLTELYRAVSLTKAEIFQVLAQAQQQSEHTQAQIHSLAARIKDSYRALNTPLEALDSIRYVPLPNLPTLADLKKAVAGEDGFKPAHGNIFENGGLQQILSNLDQVMAHCQRLDQKSTGAILTFQSEIRKAA